MSRARNKLLLVALAVALGSCRPRDPRAELEVTGLETYWIVDSAVGQTNYIAPAVRFQLKNKGPERQGSIQATASFKRKGESESWGSDWQQLVPAGKPLQPGASLLVVLRSDGRYFSPGTPESMFLHRAFKDATVELFLSLGSSGWVKFGAADVERRIGTSAVATEAR